MAQILVQDTPAPLLKKLAADAKRRKISVSDAAVEVLAAEFQIAFIGTGNFSPPSRSTLKLTMPDELHRRIKVSAAELHGVTMRGLILDALAQHYGTRKQSTRRRPRGSVSTQGGITA